MTWFKVDDGLWGHPKWLATPASARGLWVTAGSWSAANLTDGRIPRHVLPSLGGKPRDAEALVKAGLWIERPGNGWAFHEWNQPGRQPTKESVLADREAAAERQRRAREKAAEKKAQEEASRVQSRRDSRRDGQPGPDRIPTESEQTATKSRQNDVSLQSVDMSVDNSLTSDDDQMSRRDFAGSHGPPDPTRPDLKNKPLQDLVCRRLFGDARKATTDDSRADLWQLWAETAGSGVDLETELRAWLIHNGDTDLRNPGGALLGWLRTAAKRASIPALPGCDRCVRGWLPDEFGQPSASRCVACRSHLQAVGAS